MTPDQIWDKINKGVFIIAELGKNFIQTEEERTTEEYLENAKRLVDEAVRAGADAVKFQTHNVEDEQLNLKVVAPHFSGERYAWVTRNTIATSLNEFWKPLKVYCDKKGIIFFSTPMSRGAAKILDEVGIGLWKIASGDVMDFPLLDYVRRSGKPVIISSGQSTVEEVEKAVNYLREKNSRVALLHCVSKYPCPVEELRIGTIKFLQKKFNIPVGFSDHSVGDLAPDITAVALGATILEKHFSFSRSLWGSDHKVSMTPNEFKDLVIAVRELERAPLKKAVVLNSDYGRFASMEQQKVMTDDEAKFRPVFRKSLMAGQDIPAGTIITADMVYAMRPQEHAGGLPSENYEEVLGKKTAQDLKKYDPIIDTILV